MNIVHDSCKYMPHNFPVHICMHQFSHCITYGVYHDCKRPANPAKCNYSLIHIAYFPWQQTAGYCLYPTVTPDLCQHNCTLYIPTYVHIQTQTQTHKSSLHPRNMEKVRIILSCELICYQSVLPIPFMIYSHFVVNPECLWNDNQEPLLLTLVKQLGIKT